MTVVGITLISVAIVIDLASFALGVRRLRGNGASGVPVVGLLMFAAGAFAMYGSRTLEWETTLRLLKWYAVVHFMLQFGILFVLDRLVRRSQ